MKCPKCGYISFDYNQVCSKCNKDISAEQAKMNLPNFRPSPPSLLGVLIGEANESNVGMQVPGTPAEMGSVSDMDISLDDAVSIDAEGADLDGGQELEISLEPDDSGEFELSGEPDLTSSEALADIDLGDEAEEISFETGEISLDDSLEPEVPSAPADDEISLDLGGISLEEPEEEISMSEVPAEGQGELDLGLDELTHEATEIPSEITPEDEIEETGESDIEIESMPLDVDKGTEEEEQLEIELNLDDLKINETGELEIGKDLETSEVGEETPIAQDLVFDESPAVEEEEETLDIGDLSAEEPAPEEAEESLDLGDLVMDKTAGEGEMASLDLGDISLDATPPEEDKGTMISEDLPSGETAAEDSEDSLDLGDLVMDETTGEEEIDSIDLGDLSIEEPPSKFEDKTLVQKEPPSLDESSLEDLLMDDTSADAGKADMAPEPKSSDTDDDELSLDFENLDLDLDLNLDDSEDKK